MGTEDSIVKAERSFEFYHLSEKEMEAAIVGLEGNALAWFRWENKRNPITNWRTLKKLMLRHFRGRRGGSLMEQWLTQTQVGDVEDYETRFIQFASNVVSEEFLIANFIKGLDCRIQVELRLMDPVTMEEALEWAIKIEKKLLVTWKTSNYNEPKIINPSLPNPNRTYTYHKGNYSNTPTPQNLNPNPHKYSSHYPQHQNSHTHQNSQTHPNTQHLSDKEFQEKKCRRLCYHCDEKWKVGHVCKRKELSVLIFGEIEAEGEVEEEYYDVEEGEVEVILETPVSVSLNSVVGIDNPKTMKPIGKFEGVKVVVMIDPGATHNFISSEIVATLGTGETRVGKRSYQNVILDLGVVCITETFLPLELGHSNVILVIEWLAKLGTIGNNWKTPMMQFQWKGNKVLLRGDASLERSLITLKSMMKTIKKTRGGGLVELMKIEGTKEVNKVSIPSGVPEELNNVVEQFTTVFHMPNELPPVRSKQHHVVLKEGTNPISVRPYLYPQVQKEEIERLKADMLQAGIIQPSCIPFSSPVLLVKKKDGSWRFCVDYRALNRETVADKFPIPGTVRRASWGSHLFEVGFKSRLPSNTVGRRGCS